MTLRIPRVHRTIEKPEIEARLGLDDSVPYLHRLQRAAGIRIAAPQNGPGLDRGLDRVWH